MEEGSPQKSLSFSLEPRKQPQHDFNSATSSYFTSPQLMEKQLRMAETGDDFQQSRHGFLSVGALQNMQAAEMGTSFSRAQAFGLFGNSDFNSQAQQGYSALDATLLENSTPLRSMGIQDIRNSFNGLGGPNPAGCGGSDYLQVGTSSSSRLKRKANYQDDHIAQNSRSYGGLGLGFSSSNLTSLGNGYSLYDERYEAIGLPVDPHLRIFNATNSNGKSKD